MVDLFKLKKLAVGITVCFPKMYSKTAEKEERKRGRNGNKVNIQDHSGWRKDVGHEASSESGPSIHTVVHLADVRG